MYSEYCLATFQTTPIAWILTAVLGLSVGSFVNVLIWRLPHDESIVRPRSRCPQCGNLLRWYHNIPVISWVMLRGRCGFCRSRISWIYPLVELLCAGLFLMFFWRYGASPVTIGFWYFAATLVAILFIDWEHQIIPNQLSYPLVIVGLLVSLVSPHITFWQSFGGAVVGFGGFLGIAYLGEKLFKKESLGGGDIKLAAGLGAFLGIWKVLLVFILSAFVGLAASLIMMAFSKELREHRVIPFGPFLAIAAVIAGVWGDTILHLYVRYVFP